MRYGGRKHPYYVQRGASNLWRLNLASLCQQTSQHVCHPASVNMGICREWRWWNGDRFWAGNSVGSPMGTLGWARLALRLTHGLNFHLSPKQPGLVLCCWNLCHLFSWPTHSDYCHISLSPKYWCHLPWVVPLLFPTLHWIQHRPAGLPVPAQDRIGLQLSYCNHYTTLSVRAFGFSLLSGLEGRYKLADFFNW